MTCVTVGAVQGRQDAPRLAITPSRPYSAGCYVAVTQACGLRVHISVIAGPAGSVAEISDNGPPASDDLGPFTRPPAGSVPDPHRGTGRDDVASTALPRPAARASPGWPSASETLAAN